MTKLKCLLLLAACLTFAWQASGAPSITSVTGTVTDGDTLTIAGTQFGQHDLTYTWLGGINGYINAAADTLKVDDLGADGWITGANNNKQLSMVKSRPYSSAWPLVRTNRSRALQVRAGAPERDSRLHYDAGFGYTPGGDADPTPGWTTGRTFYISWWSFWDVITLNGGAGSQSNQWKQLRVQASIANPDWYANGVGGMLLSHTRLNGLPVTGQGLAPYCSCGNHTAACGGNPAVCVGYKTIQQCSNFSHDFAATQFGERWVHHELYATSNPPDSTEADMTGKILYTQQFDGGPRITLRERNVYTSGQWCWHESIYPWETGVLCVDSLTYEGATATWNAWNQFMFENYTQAWDARFAYDDVYIQFGTFAHVVVGDNKLYNNCTQTEIQEPIAWSDTLASIRFNLGGLNITGNDCLYAFVVDSLGAVSPGYKIVNSCVPCCPDSCKPDCTAACIDAAQ